MPRARMTSDGKVHWQCPGCDEAHTVPVAGAPRATPGPQWTFNANFDLPTLDPSVAITGVMFDKDPTGKLRCHSTITAGRVQFHSDSSHALANKTVDLPEL